MKKTKKRKNKYLQIANMVYWIAVFGIIGTGLYTGKELYEYFFETKEIAKSSDIKISEQEPYTLYLTSNDKAALTAYQNLSAKVYNKDEGDFTSEANNASIKELEKEYNKLPDSLKQRESYIYTLITSLWPIKSEYKNFFTNTGAINSSTTPNELKKFIDKNGPVVKKYLDDDTITSKKVFLNRVYQDMHNLGNDIYVLGQIINMFDSTFTASTESIKVKKDVSSQGIVDYNTLKDQLIFKWSVVNDILTPVINKSTEILKKHDTQIEKIEIYTRTKENKNQFDTFVSTYNNYKSSLIDIPKLTERKDLEQYKDTIKFDIKEEYSDTIKKDDIISQFPSQGDYKKFFPGSVMQVVISKGKKPEEPKEKPEEPKEKPKESSTTTSNSSSNTNSSQTKTDVTESSTGGTNGSSETE